jgi:hypothetical protein
MRSLRLVTTLWLVSIFCVGAASATTSTPSPRPTGVNKNVAAQPSAPSVTPLSQKDQYDLSLVQTWLSFGKEAVLWPATLLIVLMIGRGIGRDFIPAPNPQATAPDPEASGALKTNMETPVSTEERTQATEAAEIIMRTYRRYGFECSDRRKMTASGPAAAPDSEKTAIAESKTFLEPYFRNAFQSMLRSQAAFLEALAQRPLLSSDARVFLDDASIPFRPWLEYMERFSFIDRSSGTSADNACIAITGLGRLFLGWCDRNGFTSQTIAAAGRDI